VSDTEIDLHSHHLKLIPDGIIIQTKMMTATGKLPSSPVNEETRKLLVKRK
jgi:hypothetical protein